jgi:hypothetical protein
MSEHFLSTKHEYITNLKDIASNRICSHRLYEVHPSSLEGNRVLCPILRNEKGLQIIDFCPSHLIP